MIGGVLKAYAVCLLIGAGGESRPAADVFVLDAPQTQHMRDALDRVQCPYRSISDLQSATLSRCQVLVLSGKKPPLDLADATAVKQFVQSGGAVLAVGGGGGWLIDQKLFDADGYYFSGTTIHMTSFHGYHRLTFGYPGAKPEDGWTAGVPMLLRATEGPLLELGPQATSILGCGGPYSAAAFQRIGRGLVLLIGPDPQGGNAYHSLDKPTLTPGSTLKTERLLANAIAFLKNPNCNVVPNSGFEENVDLQPPQSNWQIVLRRGAASEWCKESAPEGDAFLRLHCPQQGGSASVQPYCPLAVERGAKYRVSCLYKSSAPWTLDWRQYAGPPGDLKEQTTRLTSVSASADWRELEAAVSIPADLSYAKPLLTLGEVGELCVDRLVVRRLDGSE